MTPTHKIALAFLVCTLLGIVGSMDARDAEAAQDEYCDMVASGSWPDFNKNYGAMCAIDAARGV
jgi:hypothetical protein